jgi:hypothetical protein
LHSSREVINPSKKRKRNRNDINAVGNTNHLFLSSENAYKYDIPVTALIAQKTPNINAKEIQQFIEC